MQTKDELEQWYEKPDPWGYETNPDDLKRKKKILAALFPWQFKRALDIGAGEGWITKDLPAGVIEALELSETAARRIPSSVNVVSKPTGKYDLIILTGVMYKQYDYKAMGEIIEDHIAEGGTILSCHIEDWLMPLDIDGVDAKLVRSERFPYREYTELLEVYKCV